MTRKEWQAKKYKKGRTNKARQERNYKSKKAKTEGHKGGTMKENQ